MEAAALEQIIALALKGTQIADADHRTIVVPAGYSLQSLEPFAREPVRYRGTYKTTSIADFIEYCREWNSGSTRIFLDPEAFFAVARMDHGILEAPEWGDHQATLQLKATAPYAALQQIHERHFEQDALIEFILDWADVLSFSSSADTWKEIDIPQAVAALRKLKVEIGRVSEHEETDHGRRRSLLEQAVVTSKPPAMMKMRCAPFHGLQECTIGVRLVYLPKDPPVIKPRILAQEELKQAWADEFKDLLLGAHQHLSDGIAAGIHIGSWISGKTTQPR